MQLPGPPFAFGNENDLRTSRGAVPSDDVTERDAAYGQADSIRIVVPRLNAPLRLLGVPLEVSARLLEVASGHLRRLGAKGVTVSGVAAEAGMTHANVYRYFPSKDALLDAVAGRWLRDVEAELARIADAPDPADDKIERLLTALASVQRETLVHEPNLFAVHLDATVQSRPLARRHRVRLRGFVEHIVEEGIGANTFVARDRERAIAYIFDASYRFTHPLAIKNDADLPSDLVDARLGAVILMIQKVLRTGTL